MNSHYDNDLQIIYKHHKPHGIRDKEGFLFFFPEIVYVDGQKEISCQEVEKQFKLADYLLSTLKIIPALDLAWNSIKGKSHDYII